MTPGTLMMGVDGRLRLGNGQGQDGVPGVGRVGTTVGVVVGECDDDGLGGVFRVLGGGVLDSCTIDGSGSVLGVELGCVDGVGFVDVPPLTGSLGSPPGLVRPGWVPDAGFGAAHFGQATVVC